MVIRIRMRDHLLVSNRKIHRFIQAITAQELSVRFSSSLHTCMHAYIQGLISPPPRWCVFWCTAGLVGHTVFDSVQVGACIFGCTRRQVCSTFIPPAPTGVCTGGYYPMANLTECKVINGDYGVNDTVSDTNFNFTGIETINGFITFKNNGGLTTVAFPDLVTINGGLRFEGNPLLVTIDAPKLTTINGYLGVCV